MVGTLATIRVDPWPEAWTATVCAFAAPDEALRRLGNVAATVPLLPRSAASQAAALLRAAIAASCAAKATAVPGAAAAADRCLKAAAIIARCFRRSRGGSEVLPATAAAARAAAARLAASAADCSAAAAAVAVIGDACACPAVAPPSLPQQFGHRPAGTAAMALRLAVPPPLLPHLALAGPRPTGPEALWGRRRRRGDRV
mmetsp:Transcript_35396/g.89962  ORF Transcript_35396/g.89962 Transcript_35396/m.89962 type:complete len:200 (+) Transcript_35396:653-1252(+)